MLSRLSPHRLIKQVIKHPVIAILIILLVTGVFAWRIPTLSFKTSIYDLIIEDLPATMRYEEFKAIFGSDEIIRVVIKSEGIYEDSTFKKIEVLSDTAAKISGVRRVISLPEIKRAVDIAGKWDLKQFSDVMMHVDLFKENLFSDDGKTTVLTLVLSNNADPEKVIAAVNQLIESSPKTLSLYQIWMPLVSQALAQLTQNDFLRQPPITFILVAVVLLCLYHKFFYVMLPFHGSELQFPRYL